MRYYGVQNEVKAYCNRLQSETSITVTPSLVKTLNDRVESLKKSGVWSQFSLGFNDNDGDEYLQRASVTDILGRSEVLWFVRGMKSLGLWQNMVCWPLRDYQNAGTGSTAFSLGGLGTFNGTLVNSPTWRTDGILFTALLNTHITTTLDVAGLRQFTVMAATEQRAQAGISDGIIAAWSGISDSGRYFILRKTALTIVNVFVRSGGANRQTTLSTLNGGTPDWRVWGWGTIGGSTVLTNGGVATASTVAFKPDESGAQTLNIGIQQLPNGAPYDGVIAWPFFYKDAELSAAQQLLAYNLYKQTLGSNLSLP